MSHFPIRLSLMLALLAAAVSASAQQTIVFSKPAEVSAEKANSFKENSTHRGSDSHRAPATVFNDDSQAMMATQSPVYRTPDPSVQEALNKRKNWTLLTPEEILGVPTAAQIMGVADFKNERKLSLEEKYLLRESRTAATNRAAAGVAMLLNRNAVRASQGINEPNPYSRSAASRLEHMLPPGSESLLSVGQSETASDNLPGTAQKPTSIWSGPFTQPTPIKPSPEQVANLERFRAMMEPASPPDNAAAARFSATPKRAANPNLQSLVNPAGRAVEPLRDNISRPTGLKPLPGVSTPSQTPTPKRPEWQAQLPPWMQDGPPKRNPSQGY